MNIFELLQSDYTLRIVSLGSALLGIVSGVVGSFAVLKKQGLLGDAISHASLPGIAIMFIIFQNKNTELFLLGALITGLLSIWLISSIDRYSRIKFDSAMALILSVFFGLGLVLLTYIQKIPNANQAGIDKFIFGQASTLLRRDVNIILIAGSVLIMLVVVFWKEFKILTFDAEFAESIGFSPRKLSFLLSSMLAIAIIIGLQTVGVILMSAMLIAPSVAARQWTNRLSVMVILSGFFGAASGFIGTFISSSISKMPTGPTIVIVISLFVIISLIFAPQRGLLWKYIKILRNHQNLNEDKLLFNLYYLAMNHDNHFHSHPIAVIKPLQANKNNNKANRILHDLMSKGYVVNDYSDRWGLTPEGLEYIQNHPMRRRS